MTDVALSALEESLNGLKTRVDALARASSTAVIDARLAALEASTGGVDVVARRLGTLEAEVDTMANRVEQAVKSLSPETPQIDAAITTALTNIEPRFSSLAADLGSVSARLAELGEPEKIAARIAEYQDRFANPFVAAERGYIDEVIVPSHTRTRIARALNMLREKTVENPWKKHDNIPL